MLLFKTTLMIYENKRMNWTSEWRILRPSDTEQRNPASEKIFCLQELKHSRNLNDYVRLEDFGFCKDEGRAKHFA